MVDSIPGPQETVAARGNLANRYKVRSLLVGFWRGPRREVLLQILYYSYDADHDVTMIRFYLVQLIRFSRDLRKDLQPPQFEKNESIRIPKSS